MQLNPARGRKLVDINHSSMTFESDGLCSSTPRGDGNWNGAATAETFQSQVGLCSSTPRGDGNFSL